MRLDTQVQPQDVEEALRLFRVSTMAANSVDRRDISGGEGLERAEQYMRHRLNMHAAVNRRMLLEEAVKQGHNAMAIAKALHIMIMRGEIQESNQGRMIKRVK
eukprot:CAMPEP_0116573676 /NCGR_PEP_ID=MMETSP0397-20121206/18929_1 /TAXON_ID=216820 /ORGANISM="Cyclophora tenuis, Strain ECT3854" /LENGTH=102 /DNA_ID=CAMNT_0004102273 /DNA_START=215 /DNA_END=523 /DNA_ORIENTATION=-